MEEYKTYDGFGAGLNKGCKGIFRVSNQLLLARDLRFGLGFFGLVVGWSSRGIRSEVIDTRWVMG